MIGIGCSNASPNVHATAHPVTDRFGMILIRSAPTVTRNASAAASTWSTVCPGSNPSSAARTRPDPQRGRPRPGTATPADPSRPVVRRARPQLSAIIGHRFATQRRTRRRHNGADTRRPNEPGPTRRQPANTNTGTATRTNRFHHACQAVTTNQADEPSVAIVYRRTSRPNPASQNHTSPPIPRPIATSTRPIDRTRAGMIKTPASRPASCRSRPPASTPRNCRAG